MGCDPVRMDSGKDTVFHLLRVEIEDVQCARLLVFPRGHIIEPDNCFHEPVITPYICEISLVVAVHERVAVLKCSNVPMLDHGRYEGQLQVLTRGGSGWLDVGETILLEMGDVELL